MLSKDIINFLNLTSDEQKVLEAISFAPKNISQLARTLKVPRTTLYTAIASLLRRRLIEKSKKGKATMITLLRSDMLISLQNIHGNSSSPQLGFSLIQGKDALLQVWKEAVKIPNSRIKAIQPIRSMETTVKKFKPGTFVPINEALKTNHIVLEAIVHEDAFKQYMNIHKDDPHIQKKIAQSFFGRMNDTTVVGRNYLNSNSDLIITNAGAFLLNWENETGVHIQNKDLILLLTELFQLARGYGKKIDLNELTGRWAKKA